MKKLIPILVLTSLLFITGCINGRPPEYSVSNPYAISDSSGGVIIAYQVNSGDEAGTYVQRFSAQGDWGKGGIELGSGSASFIATMADFASLIPDNSDNITAVYLLNKNIWARKLDMAGKPVWEGETTKRISPTDLPDPAAFKAVGNSAGETIIAWRSSQNNLTVTKGDGISASYFTSIATPDVDRFDIASDDGGNVFIIWKDRPSYSEGNIYIQKVNPDGQKVWQSEGILLSNVHGPAYARGPLDSWIISDGEGGAIAVWINLAQGEKSDGLNLYAQRIGANGEFLWEEGGVPIGDRTSLQRSQSEPSVISDGSGGVIIFWEHGVRTVWAQHLDSQGNSLWAENGIEIVSATGSDTVYYSAACDRSGNTALVWNYTENGKRVLRSQKLDAGGKKLWGNEGVQVSTIPAYWAGYAAPARIASDGSDGYIITWASGKNIKDKTSSYIQRILPNGGCLWGQDGLKLNK